MESRALTVLDASRTITTGVVVGSVQPTAFTPIAVDCIQITITRFCPIA
jgi:hypothetical protein